jgi:glyoxylase-like metal-dependent hydrolase (beta-lactamase superfamily II)
MIFRRFIIEGSRNIAYMIGDKKSGKAVVVDPSGAVTDIINMLQKENLKLVYIINTHAHQDHTAGNNELASQTGATIMMHEAANIGGDIKLKDGEIVKIDGINIKVIHTPGHTPDGICLLLNNKILTGDTLFVGECGRTDLPGGDPGILYDSLFGKIIKLDDDLEVYPGHDYGEKPDSTLEYEKKHNYVLKPRSKEEFIRFMRE